ncbi:MAG: 2-oxo-4-hydroxy-4-carboxy-5-ureidoimidazoline decarboxylase [Alphaproteobacteria bacterium]|nr:MAG: 2-oxo-4-hydroxy-4-carboxy-5-ureidoimidazoline decarboxylase [Alphaproteobacteria bacterium]
MPPHRHCPPLARTPCAGESHMNQTDFVANFGGIYEHSPWVAERAFDKEPTLTLEAVTMALAREVDNASHNEQLALLRAHPDLAGRLGIDESLTDSSKSEQQGAGLDKCTREEFEAFQVLNTAYKEKFGFPFILAVKGWQRQGILKEFQRRVDNDRDTEFNEALAQVHRIARFRLEDFFASNS